MTTLEKIKNLDDFKVIRLFRNIEAELSQQTDSDAETLLNQLPPSLQQLPEIQELKSADEAALDAVVPNAEAVRVARATLEWMAENPGTSPYLADKLANWNDNEMVAETILAVGGALSAIMLLSTFKISYEKEKGWQFSLGYYSADQIEPIKLIFKALFKVTKLGK